MLIHFRRGLAAILLFGLAGCVGVPVAYDSAGQVIPASVPAPYAAQAVAGASGATGTQCFAGAYVCQLGTQLPVGSQCSCPGLGAPSYGYVR